MPFVLIFITATTIAQNPLLLKDVFPGATGSGIQQIVKTSNYTFFNAEDNDPDADRGLYRTDGTPAGTIKLNLTYPTYISTKAEKLTALGNKVVFAGDNFPNYGEIWCSDGTQTGTIALERFQPTRPNTTPVVELSAMGAYVYYSVIDNSNNALLKKTDGTPGGTSLVYNFSAYAAVPQVVFLTPVNGILYFIVYDAGGTGVDQLWRSDGTTAGTFMVFDFGLNQYVASYLMVAGNNMYVMIVTPGTGNVLWKSDGTAAGTVPVKTIGTSGNNNYPPFAAMGSTLFFAGLDGNGKELWKTDGTSGGTLLVADINAGAANSNPAGLTVLNNNLYFAAAGANGNELWKFDGSNATEVKDIFPGGNSNPFGLAVSNGTILFRAAADASGTELWITDGSTANTKLVKDINPSGASAPSLITSGNPVYFSANNGVNGAEIYKYDNADGINGLRKLYVNDNSTVGDIITAAVGNNSNAGTRSEPFATVSYALTIAAAGDTIIADAGTYAEQVIIDKGITIIGAGQTLTSFIPPSTPLVPAPGPFTEIGLFETTQGIGDVHIRNLSINSNNGSQNIIIQSGGSVTNCTLINGGQGIFFRIESAIKTAWIENNTIQPNGIGVNCQGSGLTATIRNNNISRPAAYFAGIFAGLDFGPLPQLTIHNNIINNYFGVGLEVNSFTGNYNNNSIVGSGSISIRRSSGNTPNATCNWFGSTDAGVIASKISGTVNYNPFLNNGTDNSAAIGFQPVNAACSGRNTYYVNDNSLSGDVFTSAIGNNSNNGSPSAPFATISYALTQVAADDYIYVDAGIYTEQVTTDKGITIVGAGQNLTSILKPAVTVAPPAVPPSTFAEQGVIQTAQSITGDIHISNLSVTGDYTVNVTPIIIQSGGSVKNCKLQNGNQGIFVRIDPAINPATKTFVVDGNSINAEYIAVNFAGTRLTATLSNNTLAAFNPGFSTGVFAGLDFGTLAGLTVTGNTFSSFVSDGLLVNTNNGTISQNSFTGTGQKAINKIGGANIHATCNWYGSADVNVVALKITPGVTFSPWLVNGNDNSGTIGFQSVPGSCTGKQTRFYVNNNTSATRIFTTAAGSDANPGIPSSPFATISAAYQKAQTGDSLFVDAGTYSPGDATIGKSISIIGANYLLSPNDAANTLLINSTRNAETIIDNLTWTIGANDINLEGLTFNSVTKQIISQNNTSFSNIKLAKNRVTINSNLTLFNFTGSGTATMAPSAIVNSGLTITDNRFEKYDATNGTTLNINRFRNVAVTNNSFVVAGTTVRTQTALNNGGSGVVDGVFVANNTIDKASNAFVASRITAAFIYGNKINNTNNAFFASNSMPEASYIIFNNNILDGSGGVVPFIQYTRSGGNALGATSSFTAEENVITGTAVASTTTLLGSMNLIFFNTVLNPSLAVRNNKITYAGDLSTVPAHFIRPIMIRGNLANAVVEKNEISLTGINQQQRTAGVNLPVSPAITLYTENGTTSFLQPGSVINIFNNKINGFKHSFAAYDAVAGNDAYIGYGNIPAGVSVNINNNSFTGDSISINNGTVGQIVNANCNWYGVAAAHNISAKVTVATVNHSPWLTNGTDNDVATGFQPVANSCNGIPVNANIILVTNITCNGAANGAIDVLAEDGLAPYTYAWSKDGVAGFSTLEDLTNLSPGDYKLIVTDANGSIDSVFTLITEPDILTAAATGTNNICFGASSGTATVISAGGTLPYTYLWSNGATTDDISNLIAGNYSVTITDANGCTAISNYEVTQPPLLTAVATGTSTSCSNTATVAASGGTIPYNYLWSNGATTASISSIAAGTYTVIVTDANSCTASASVTVTANEAFNPAASVSNVSCFGGTNGSITVTNVNATAPFSFSIDGVNFQAGTLPYTFSNLVPGVYTISVRDANGCTGFVTKTITQPPLLTAVLNNVQSTCFGLSTGAITVTATGGSGAVNYSWTGPNGFTSSQRNINNLATGNYTLTVTDNNNCTAVLNVVVPSLNEITVSAVVTNVLCRGTLSGAINLTVSGGSNSGFTFSWTGGTTSTAEDISNLGFGNYNVSITDIGSGCVITRSYAVTQPATNLALSVIKTNATGCNSLGTITATGSGGTSPYQYKLDNGSYQNSGSFTGLYAGSYTTWVKDANGCTKSTVVSITDNGSDEYESNNSKNQAKLITISTNINGRIATTADAADWFKFTTPAGTGNYTMSLTHPAATFTFNMYAAGNNVPALVPVSTSPTSKEYVLPGNTTFYISITGGLSYTCYTLVVTPTALPITSINGNTSNEKNIVFTVKDLSATAYPNPHNGTFMLRILAPENGWAKIELFAANGQTLATKSVLMQKGIQNSVPFTVKQHGTIFYSIQFGKYKTTGKVISLN